MHHAEYFSKCSPGRMISCCSRDNSPASTDNPGCSDVFVFSFSSAQNFENINSVCVIMPPSFPGSMISCTRDNSPASTDDQGYLGSSRIRKFPESIVRMPRAERRTQIWTVRHVPPPSPYSPPLHLIRSLHTSHSPPSSLTMQSCCTLRGTYAGKLRSCCMLRYAFASSLPLTPPQLPPHTDAYPSGRHHSNRNDEGTATAAVAAVLPTARAGPPGWRRRREPGPGTSSPGGRAGSGAAAAAVVAAALPTALAGPPGRPCREPRTDPGASARAPA